MAAPFYGKLYGTTIASAKPFLMWANVDGGQCVSFDTFREASDYRIVLRLQWKNDGGRYDAFPWEIYALMNGVWEIIQQIGRAHV